MYIKRILILMLLLVAICAFTSCNNSKSNTDQIPDTNDLIIDTNTDTGTSDTDTNTGSTTTDDLNSDITTDSIKEVITAYGNFTTLHKTIPSNDRMKQMRNSKAVFNTGSSYTPDELSSTRIQALIISSAKFLFPNAADLMDHYLNGKGENYELDVEDFLEDKTVKENMLSDLNAALRAAENIKMKKAFTIT